MSKQQIELSYEQKRLPWYGRRRLQWWLAAAIVVAVAVAINATQPIWPRYRYYRMQQQAATYMLNPSQVLMQCSSTQPYTHMAGPFDRFLVAFQTAACHAMLDEGPWGGTSVRTPIFCGLRTTKGGSPQIVRVYSEAVADGTSSHTFFMAVEISKWRNVGWILTGSSGPSNDSADWEFCQIAAPLFHAWDSLTVLTGSANPRDSSEVDIPVVLNGQTATVKFHVTEVSGEPGEVGVAVDHAALGRVLDPFPNFTLMHGYVWPLPAK